MTAWTNGDGLQVEFNRDRTKKAAVGKPATFGEVQQVVAILEASALVLAGGLIGGRPNLWIPVGSYISKATLIPTEAFTSAGAATLDLGLANKDGTYTNLDEDGIDVAIALTAIDAIGETVACDGALIGTILTTGGFLSYDLDAALFTAGKAFLIVEYFPVQYPNQTAL